MPIVCPVHNQQDMVQSIPALIAGDTARGTFSGPSGGFTYIDGKRAYTAGSTTLHGTMTTEIAEQLAFPLPPNLMTFLDIPVWSFLFLFSFCIVIGPFLVWKGFKNRVVNNPEIQEKAFGHGDNGLSIFMLFLGWQPLVWFFIPQLLTKLREDSEYDRRYDLWVKAHRRWESFYYCHKCGIVIDPERKQYFKPAKLREQLQVSDFM